MGRNSVIIIVSIFLILVLGATFLICSYKLFQLQNAKRESIINSEYPIYEEFSNTKDLPVSKYFNFTVYRDDKSEVNLAEYENNPIMVLFFDDNDVDSIEVLNRVDNLYEQYEDKVKFLMINTNKEINYNLKENYNVEIFYDFYSEATRNYNITELPAMIYINSSNEIFNAKTGVPSVDALEANLDILSENY